MRYEALQHLDSQYVVVDYGFSHTFHVLFSPRPEMNELLLEDCPFRSKGQESKIGTLSSG
jgi:hypothetical protein